MSDARGYAVWPEPRSRSLKGSRPSVPHGTNFLDSWVHAVLVGIYFLSMLHAEMLVVLAYRSTLLMQMNDKTGSSAMIRTNNIFRTLQPKMVTICQMVTHHCMKDRS